MAPEVHPSVEAYLGNMFRPLERTIDPQGFAEARANILFHLEELVARRRQAGLDEEAAVREALDAFGPAEPAGRALLDEWCRGEVALGFARGSSSALWWSFGFFGLAFGLVVLATEYVQLWPGAGSTTAIYFVRTAAVVAPILAGILTGRLVPTGDLRSLTMALGALLAYAALLGLLFHSEFDGALFPGIVLAWVPLGAVSTAATAWFRRHGRPRRGGPTSRRVTA